MTLQVTRVVKNPNDIDDVLAAAPVNGKMPGLSDDSEISPGPIPAEK